MKKKWIAVLLTGAMLATSAMGGTMAVFAGIKTNKPAGDGLMNGAELSDKFIAMNDSEPSCFKSESSDHGVIYTTDGDNWAEMIPYRAVPKETMAKDNVKVSLTYKIQAWGEKDPQLKLIPAAKTVEEKNTYGFVLGGNNAVIYEEGERASRQESDPMTAVKGTDDGSKFDNTEMPFSGDKAVSWTPRVWPGVAKSTFTDSNGKGAYLLFEMTINEQNWVDVTIKTKAVGAADWKPNYCIVTNWAPYDGSYDFYTNVWNRYAAGFVLDGATLEVSYTEDQATKTETLYDSNFDNKEMVFTSPKKTLDTIPVDGFLARSKGATKNDIGDEAEFVVTEPQKDFRIVTTDPLTAGEGYEKAFDMTAALRLRAIEDGIKVGIAFGLPNYRSPISAPTGDVSFLYLTKADGEVKLGVENIDKDGVATPVGDQHTVAGAKTGDSATFVAFEITGKSDGSIEVKVNEAEAAIKFEGLHLNGCIAFCHTGEGAVTYAIKTNSVSLTGYEFIENEGKAVTSNFNGNYINPNKFDAQSKIAISTEMQKGPNTAHELDGLVTDNGKIGFYGTGTNTRLMFKEKYADFVLQFDYISEPFKTRGESLVASKIFNPLMITFGVTGEGSIMPLEEGYGIAIVDGNPGQGQWGAESLVMCHDATKFHAEGLGGELVVLSTLKEDVDSDTAILASGGALDGKYCVPDTESKDFKYSFYNTTTRIKLVVVNNKFAVFIAPIKEDGTADEYMKTVEYTVSDASGFVGFATDSPGWCAIDNVAITPVAREKALELGFDPTLTADLIPDVAPAEMATDSEPAPLAKPTLSVDGTKVKWDAVEHAKEYQVTVKLGEETKLKQTVQGTEIDLASLTAAGEYSVTVEAIPDDEEAYIAQSAKITYTVAAAGGTEEPGTTPGGSEEPGTTPGGTDEPDTGKKKGCRGAIGGWAFAAIPLVVAAAAVIILPKKRKNK